MKIAKQLTIILLIATSPIIGIIIYSIFSPLTEEQFMQFLLTYVATVGGVTIAFYLKTSWEIKKMETTKNELLIAILIEIQNNINNINQNNIFGISFEVFKGVSKNPDFLADVNKTILIDLFDIYSDLRKRIGLVKIDEANSHMTLKAFKESENYFKLLKTAKKLTTK